MTDKYQQYATIADEQSKQITGSMNDWTSFLNTVGRLYKYPFEEQLMIHAQRPDAVACAPIEVWNKPMNRYVRRGSKGIALLDNTGSKPRLKYVFDVSDTQDGWRNPHRPFLWELKPEHEAPVLDALDNAYSVSDWMNPNNTADVLYMIASSAAARYYDENEQDILFATENSFLDGLDDTAKGAAFMEALYISTAYTLMSRCGIDSARYISNEDFQSVFDFNTPEAVYALGKAVSMVSEEVLREIEVTIKKYERQKAVEQEAQHEPSSIQPERGLSDTQHSSADGNPSIGTIRHDAEELLEQQQGDSVHDIHNEGNAVSSLHGNRETSGSKIGTDDDRVDGEEPTARQGHRPDELDGTHEQSEIPSRGSHSQGTDLQLKDAEPPTETPSDMDGVSVSGQLVLFPTERQQLEVIHGLEPTETITITQEDIDNAIIAWNGDAESKIRVFEHMHEHARARDTANFLKEEYGGEAGVFTVIKDGAEPVTVPWAKVQRRVAQLMDENKFLTPDERTVADNALAETWDSLVEENSQPAAEVQTAKPTSPPPVFFVDWKHTQFDFDLNLYQDRDVIGYNKDGVEYSVGRMSGLTYITTTTGITPWGDVTGHTNIPRDIWEQIHAYRNGELTEDEVRQTYLTVLDAFKNQQATEQEAPEPQAITETELAPEPEAVSAHPPANFRITDDNLGEGGAKTKYAMNVAAIRTLQAVESENRFATPEEQEVLSRYVGWGGLQEAFDDTKTAWAKEYSELKGLLSPEEYDSAMASTLNAHYTSPTVIKAMYETMERLGFKDGNLLEPAMGVGNFFGLLPDSMQNAKLYGVELDSITGRIAKQLYQDADIKVMGFEQTDTPDSFFDAAIGNVPFGQYKVADSRYDKHNFNIHDFFFAKTLDQVRPGGVVAFITSKGTLDKANPEVRKYLAQRAELLGAVRLPNNAFKANAGTEVTSDIIFLQKRDRLIDIEPDWVHLGQTDDGIPINHYFADNPHMVLGTMSIDSGMRMYGNENTATCVPIEGADLGEQLKSALSYVEGQITEVELDDLADEAAVRASIPADPNVKNFSYTIAEDELYFRENSRMFLVEMPAATMERVRGMVELRDCVRKLIDMQLYDYPAHEIQAQQQELNTLYDSFTKKHGLINATANARAFQTDSSYYLLSSLEILDDDKKFERKSDMFTKRTIKQHREVTSVDTSSEALAVSIGQKARVDLPYMAQLTGFTHEKIAADLQGVIFKDPKTHGFNEPRYVTADEYLSGNVREKLLFANQMVGMYPEYEVNVKALEAAQPTDLDASEIAVRLGSTWVDKEYIEQFMYELLQPPNYFRDEIQVKFSELTGEWSITGKARTRYDDVLANVTYGTSRANAYKILEDSLNLRDVRIYDTKEVDGKDTRVLNRKETMLAAQKQDAIKQAFKDWVFKDPERRQDLVATYNERFNSTRPREYDGSHIQFSGMSPEITLKPHQTAAIARILYGGNTLLAHEVGAGKTFEMVGAAMESKRLGLCNKSLMVVPNHLTEQMAGEFLRLYPSANILVATKKDFETKNRKKFCAKIATGDYDAVIIGHSQFERIPLSKDRQQRLLNEQITEISEAIRETKRNRGEQFTVKQMEKTKKSLEGRLQKLINDGKKDDVVTFEELGIDRLFVDESHNYKNLFLVTKMRNVAGLSTSEAQKSSDMFMKTRYMDELTGGKGTIFATGTPITNSMSELYTVQRYLQYDTLQQKRMLNFDAWASTFGETQTSIELAPQGDGYRARTRFAKFQNLPELMNMFGEVADIKTADTLDLPRPKVNFHTVVVPPTDIQKEMVQELSERAKAVHEKKVDPTQDNMLCITNDGRKIGLDQRLMNPLLPDDPGSKVNACMENIYRIWEETADKRLTQLAFCDFSTPNKDGRFNVYDDIRDKLVAKGVPKNEIAFIHDYNTETQKKDLFAKVRSGKVRVLFGSTFKCGAGTNVQDRLISLHDIDCPWRPSDLTQRFGRIARQGNLNPEVEIFRYVTEGTFDSYLFQTVEKKQEFISQIMTSKSPVRSCDDMDEEALSYAEIKALCAGNPLIAEKMNLDIEVSKLKLLKSEHQSQRYNLEDALLKNFPKRIEATKGHIGGFKADMARLETNTHRTEEGISPMTIGDKTYTDRSEAGAALLAACQSIRTTDTTHIGSYRGFDMYISFDKHNSEFTCSMKGSMTHTATLGADESGNITRINNAFDKIPQRLASSEAQLQTLYEQVENAKVELTKPFAFEAEFIEKSARLAELDATLNMDDSPGTEQSAEQDLPLAAKGKSADTITHAMSAKERPSLLAALEKGAERSRAEFDGGTPPKSKETTL